MTRHYIHMPSIFTTLSSIKPHNRKLQLLYNDMSFQPINTLHNYSTSASPPPKTPPPSSEYSIHPPFDSSMALTVLVLLTAFFFMGFFSVYLRRLGRPTPPRRSQPNAFSDSQLSTVAVAVAVATSRKGLDAEIIKSLPVYAYYQGDTKYQTECPICLGEFEEKEMLKMIPYCKHVFHLECIDTWLKMHVNCPVCRGTQFFDISKGKASSGGCRGSLDGVDDHVANQQDGRSTMEISATCIQVGTTW
ncbi:hypothetical protein JCGZ_05415 [Jatropha curcas]|uniref:RING-type E3 ubiquitin transferase n=1 Tax=Jatropha curcas TaxID=180498 RepID=A0A067L9N2_JATCU|nr:RING-H2 finger protein ATL57 [Jatropha curcas]KDP43948.1 hypothetical protein JCGZ_05415 [Jatropha curcas]